VLFITHCI